MDNVIIKGFLKKFSADHEMTDLSESDQFENFVNYCVIGRLAWNDFEIDRVNVGKEGNIGIDGLAIIVNEQVIFSVKDIAYFTSNGQIDVEFIFTQAKTSAKFDLGDILKFISSVKNVFVDTVKVKKNENMNASLLIKDDIYSRVTDLREAPKLTLYYGSTGLWDNQNEIVKLVDQELKELKKSNLFSCVNFYPADANKLQSYYKGITNKSEKEIDFRDHTILPQIDSVAEAYLGIVKSRDFLNLITDDEGYLLKSIFYDNVRDYQGENSVNTEISDTIKTPGGQSKFCILNNGVTVVARSISKVGTKFILKDFQIVNGCQTSHIVYKNKGAMTEDLFIPIKIISTTDAETTNKIIQATNRQTEVKIEAFESLKPFHKKLEDFYISMRDEFEECLHYERRSKQYAAENIANHKIISLARQTTSFIATYLNEPHSTNRYYGELLSSYKKKIYQENHSLYPYFVCALLLTQVEKNIRKSGINKKWRYHLLMMIRIKITGNKLPSFSSKKIAEDSKKMLNFCKDQDRITTTINELYKRLIELDKQTSTKDKIHNSGVRAFTKKIEEMLEPVVGNDTKPLSGLVKYFNAGRGFGFIDLSGRDYFFHITNVNYSIRESLCKGMEVSFEIEKGKKGDEAISIEAVD